MKRLMISIPNELKIRLDAMPHINWPEVARQGIKKKIDKIKLLEARGEL